MDRQFPSIKSTSMLPVHSSKVSKPQLYLKPKVPSTKQNLLSNRLIKNTKNHTSRLPPINASMEIPVVSPVVSNPFYKQISSRRTLSNHNFLSEFKNAIQKFSVKSKKGSSMGIPKPQNQDAYIINPSITSQKFMSLFAVCDGHGTEGHLVSGMIKSNFTKIFEKHLESCSPDSALLKSVTEINEVVMKSKIDSEFSGSTFIGVIIHGDNLYCANVGDSGAIVGTYTGSWGSTRLSEEHNPLRKDEADRIVANGGRIGSHVKGGPLRIWYLDENFPGLAMTRSIGDKASRVIGLIGDAEIFYKKLTKHDKFVIIASDGLWEFIGYNEAVNLVGEMVVAGKSELSCEKLLREATLRWNCNSMSVDDITIIVVFLCVN